MRQTGFIGGFAGIGCFLQAIIISLYLFAATWATDTITNAFGTDFPWIVDLIIGLFTGWVGIWIAVAIAIFA